MILLERGNAIQKEIFYDELSIPYDYSYSPYTKCGMKMVMNKSPNQM